jgi:zinc ribbon protein
MKCPVCQEETEETNNYCPHCGTPLQPSVAAPRQGGVAASAGGNFTVGGSVAGRDINYILLSQQGTGGGLWYSEVPLLEHSRPVDLPPLGITGIQITDRLYDDKDNPPRLFVSVFVLTSQLSDHDHPPSRKWLFVQADMRPALNLRIRVRPSDLLEATGLIDFLRHGREGWGWALFSPRPKPRTELPQFFSVLPSDYFQVWHEGGEKRLMLATYTSSGGGISIHARFTEDMAEALAAYLEEAGFTEPSTPRDPSKE